MKQFRLFNPAALAHFKKFCQAAQNPQAAFDAKPVFGVIHGTPSQKRAMAHDRLNRAETYPRQKWARDVQERSVVEANSRTAARDDEMDDDEIATDVSEPDRDSVAAVLACISESLGDEAAAEVMRVLHLKWEGVAGEQPGLDGETRADRVTGDDEPEDEDATVATSVWPGAVRQRKMDKPVNEFAKRGATDLPPPFKGRPTPGGKLVGDAALKRYHDRFPNAARLDGTTTYVRPRGRASMAMDAASSAAADGFSKRFPDAMKIGLDPIQCKRG